MNTPAEQLTNTDAGAVAADAIGKIEDLKRVYFSPNDKEAAKIAVEKARAIADAHVIPVAFNWPAEDGEKLPEDYGIAIIPIPQRREGQGNVIIGLHIAGVPSPESIIKSEKGSIWANDALVKVLINKYSNAVRPREGQATVTAPFSMEDFITSATRESGLAFFREIQGVWVGALKKKGLKLMNAALLKQTLASAAFAEQTFPKIQQSVWEGLLNKMIAAAQAVTKEAGIITTWLETRDAVEFETSEFELDDLDSLINAVEESTAAEVATPEVSQPAI